MNVYTADFIKDFQPFTGTIIGDSPENRVKLKNLKKELKDKGYIIRTTWRSSLGCYSIRAIRYKHGEPTPEIKDEMTKWARF